MQQEKDNTTPMSAGEYDAKISRTIPYYNEFHEQTISIIRAMQLESIDWLDLGCGTGTLAQKAEQLFDEMHITMADPSAKMLEEAQGTGINQ